MSIFSQIYEAQLKINPLIGKIVGSGTTHDYTLPPYPFREMDLMSVELISILPDRYSIGTDGYGEDLTLNSSAPPPVKELLGRLCDTHLFYWGRVFNNTIPKYFVHHIGTDTVVAPIEHINSVRRYYDVGVSARISANPANPGRDTRIIEYSYASATVDYPASHMIQFAGKDDEKRNNADFLSQKFFIDFLNNMRKG